MSIENLSTELERSRAARDEGMATAEAHADHVSYNWSDNAYQYLLNYMDTHSGPFMMEEVRNWATDNGCVTPPNLRAWGSVMMKAVRSGKVEKIGYKCVTNEKAHMAPCGVWRKL